MGFGSLANLSNRFVKVITKSVFFRLLFITMNSKNMKYQLSICIGILLGLFSSLSSAFAGEIWVSPHGNDLNTGTRQAPVLTLTQALKQAREWRRLSDPAIADGIHICLENGAYPLSEPIFLRPEDSGTADSPTIIRGMGEEASVLHGGMSITRWKKQGKLWVADVPEFNGYPLDFRQLWVNGKKAIRARDVSDFEKSKKMLEVKKREIENYGYTL